MRLKTKRLISALLVLALAFQLAGCLGIVNDMDGKPSDLITSLESAVHSLNGSNILVLTNIDKGSSRYKEYSEILDLSSYSDDAVECYKAVASAIDIKYDETTVESGEGIFKVHVTFKVPEWKKIFKDTYLSGAGSVIKAISESEKDNVDITLRLIRTQNGLRIKNGDDLMEILDFVGYEIEALLEDSESKETTEPSEETSPTEPSQPAAPEPTTPDPDEPSSTTESAVPSESDSSATKPSKPTAQNGTKEDLAAAYADYAKLLKDNQSGIEWFERNVNSNACGLADFNGDAIPELFFFSKSIYSDNYINFYIYSYRPDKQKTSMSVIETLTEAGSDISEFFVLKTTDGKLVTYKGYVNDGSAICNYCIYEDNGTSVFMAFAGNLFCTITPEIENEDGSTTSVSVCTVSGYDKYNDSTKVDLDEFRRVEKKLLGSSESLLSAQFQRSRNSAAFQILGKKTRTGMSYDKLIKKLAG